MNLHCEPNAVSRRLHHMQSMMAAVAYMGTAVHLSLIVFFALVGATPLALLNVASSAIWLYCTGAVRKGETQVAVPLALAEVYVHALACTAVLGWTAGFQHYLWAGIPFIVFNRRWSPATMAAIAAVFALTYVAAGHWTAGVAYHYFFPGAIPYVRAANILVAFSALTFACLYFRKATQTSLEHWRELASTDPLTGLYNRRRVTETMAPGKRAKACHGDGTLTIALGDIDHFKAINDRHGHEFGDAVIREVAQRLRGRLRKTDFVVRWGGDEFLVVMPGNDAGDAQATIEGLCADIAREPVRFGPAEVSISMTFGIVQHCSAEGMDKAVRRADAALYLGKEAGRNRVMVAA
ncbi:MAG TPA: GGDEF domain-containing protein [Rhodocyclaceae bacterium]